MNCNEARAAFSPRLDGALSAEEASRVEAHLAACPACAAEWGTYRSAMGLLTGVPGPAEPVGLPGRVEEAWRSAPPAQGVLPWRLAVAAVALYAAGAFAVARPWRHRKEGPIPVARSAAPQAAAPPKQDPPAGGHKVTKTEKVLPDGSTETDIVEDWTESGVVHHRESKSVRSGGR